MPPLPPSSPPQPLRRSSSGQATSSQHPSANGGIRIAGIASRTPSASASGPSSSALPSPAPQLPKQSPKSPIKLDREKHASHRLPARPDHTHTHNPKATESQQRQWPQRPSVAQHRSSSQSAALSSRPDHDDEEEEGAIDDSALSNPAATSSFTSTFRPPPPKTPPHPSNPRRSAENHREHDRNQRSDVRKPQNHTSSYQPRSPSPPRRTQPASHAQASHLRSPDPPASPPRRTNRDHDNGASRTHTDDRHHRAEPDLYRRTGSDHVSSRHPEHRNRDDRYSGASTRDWDRTQQEPARPWDDDWRREDRSWGNDRRGGGGAGRDRDREHNRHFDRTERDRPWDHHRYSDRRDEPPRDASRNGNGRDRELFQSTSGRGQLYAGWSPTPPHHKSEGQPTDLSSNGNNGETFAPRPPSRMGRAAPPPPLLSHTDRPLSSNANRDSAATLPKRPRSRSPPAGLLKRKANFNAVIPPTLANVNDKDAAAPAESDNVAPGAPLPHNVETMQSPVMPGSAAVAASRPGSALATALPSSAANTAFVTASTAAAAAVATPADANFNATCEALDDFTLPSVRLSCLPRKQPEAPTKSGRERRKARPPPVPLNQRKFVGCSSLDDYEISIKLGQGTFGEVLKGRQILTGTQVALKKVTIHDAKDGLPITALREIKLLKKLKHPSIVPVIDMAFRPSGERGKLGDVYMVEPYMDHDLNGMLENPSIRLEHSQIKLYMKQLLEGTLYLHKNRILHRDMKAANLLINNKGQLQIADFGLARPYRDPGQSWTGKGWTVGTHRYTNMVVTRWYRPPELLAGEKKYGPPIDMWGIGCILAEMITGRPLFKGTSEINQLELIAKLCGSPNETSFPGWSSLPGVKDADPTGRPDPHPEIPGQHAFGDYPRKVKDHFRSVYDAGAGCADLIDKLLVLDPRKRLTAQQALEHEWFWTTPYPADPGSLPKYEHSKEIDRARRDWKLNPAANANVGAGAAAAAATGMGARPMMQQQQQQPQLQQPQSYVAGVAAAVPLQQQRYPRPGFPQHPHPHPHQQPQAASNAGFPGPMDMQPPATVTDAWDALAAAAAAADAWDQPAPVGSRPNLSTPNMAMNGVAAGRSYASSAAGGGGGRHPFPHAQHPPQQGRFPHPNSQRPSHAQPAHAQPAYPYPAHPAQAPPRSGQQHSLPARPPNALPPPPPAHPSARGGGSNGNHAGAPGGGNPYAM